MPSEVTTVAATITPPGNGRIVSCPDCNGIPGRDCLECRGEGRYVRRACPLCGDPSWDYVNGTDDRNGMACGSAAVTGGPPTTPAGALRYCPARPCEGLADRCPTRTCP